LVKVGVALSGGGLPGIAAHIGAMDALQSLLPKDYMAVGSSAGGIVVAGLANDMSPRQQWVRWNNALRGLESVLMSLAVYGPLPEGVRSLFHPSSQPGIINLSSVFRLIMNGNDLPVYRWPDNYGLVTSNLTMRKPEIISSKSPYSDMSAIEAMQATSAYPGLFAALSFGGSMLVDGGLYALLPVEQAIDMGATAIIALCVHHDAPSVPPEGMTVLQEVSAAIGSLLWRAEEDALRVAATRGAKVVVIDLPAKGGLLDESDFEADARAGGAAVKAQSDAIQRLLAATA
jgi:NTE family protein